MAKIHEVAKAAGVSISTVSYALSGKRPVSVETRTRIEAAAVALEYAPNAGARMLAGRKTNIFALTEPLRSDTHAPTHMAFVLATSIAARRHDYDVLLLTEEQASLGMRRVATSGLVDGIIVLDVAPDDDRVQIARRISVPTAFVGIPDDHADLVCVDLDFERAAGEAVERLGSAGHRTVGLVGHSPSAYQLSNFPPRVRDGFFGAARSAGLRAEFRMLEGPGGVQAQARRAVGELLDAGTTGVLLHCHDVAHTAVLAELDARGLHVPVDVSVISVGSSFETESFSPPLSAYPLIPKDSCDLAVELLVQSLSADKPEPGIRLIPPTFVDHGSIASARAVS